MKVRKNIYAFNNPPSGPADPTAAHELELYIDNDSQLYHSQFIPIVKNLMLKRRRGVYDRELAVKLFMYLMDAGAKKYIAEFGSRGAKIDTVFNRNTRLQAARAFRDSFETEAEYGNYDRLIDPVSNPGVRKNIYAFNNPEGFTVEPARYAQGMMAVRPQDNVQGFKGRSARLIEHLKCRWSNRERAYIVSPSKVKKLKELYDTGRDASTISGKLYENPRGRDSSVEAAARAAGLYVGVWSPGDGVTRYRFFTKTTRGSQYADYHEGDGVYTALGRKDALAFIAAYGKGRRNWKNPLTRSEAGYLLKRAHTDVREAGVLKKHGFPHDANRAAAHARGIGYAVQETGPKAARRVWVDMHTKLDRVLRNPCPNPSAHVRKNPPSSSVRAYRVPEGFEAKVASMLRSAFIWAKAQNGSVLTLARSEIVKRAIAYVRSGKPLENPLLQTIGLMANPPVSVQWDQMSGQKRLWLLGFVGYPEAVAAQYARFPWVTLSDSAKRALERQWLDTDAGRRAGTTTRRRRLALPVGANPLTRRESAQTLRHARSDLSFARVFRHGPSRTMASGEAIGRASVVRRHGPKTARRAAEKVMSRAGQIARSNPGVRLPAPGTKMTVAQALELARRIGSKSLIQQCQQAMKLQKTSDRNTKSVVWKHLPIGSSTHLDGVVAMTHYGKSPEDMYTPPKGSKKGPHMYRHRWKRSVDVLASPSGKAIVKLMGPGQKVGDWMRG